MTSELASPSERRVRPRWRPSEDHLWLAPLLVSVAYVITFATQISRLLSVTYLNADAASAPVIGQLYGGAAGTRTVSLGHLGWYDALYELATRWSPCIARSGRARRI